jgi:phage terminase small subunit
VSSIAKKLTTKQQKFVDEYIVSGNATQAAIKAGYSKRTARKIGQENLTKPDIKAALNDKMLEIESQKIGNAKEVLEFYFRVLRGEETEEVPMSTADSVITVTKTPSIKDKVSVAKEIMKRFPLYDPMEKQKLKKLTADARISEAKANVMEDNGQDVEQLLDKMLDTLAKEDLKHGSE